MSTFKKFTDRKSSELDNLMNPEMTFDSASYSGVKSMSTRQPLFIHSLVSQLENEIPLTSKAEIIFEAIKSSADSLMSDYEEKKLNLFWAKVHIRAHVLRPVTEGGVAEDIETAQKMMFSRSAEVQELESFSKSLFGASKIKFNDEELEVLYKFYVDLMGAK
jgi:hypothetical protein